MRIAFNARILSDPILRGWNRYTLNLVSGLADLGAEVYLYSNRTLDPAQLAQLPLSSVTIRESPVTNYLEWEQRWIPQQCKKDHIEIFHSPIHFGLPQFTQATCVLTLHDVIDEIYYAPRRPGKTTSQRMTAALCWMARHRADHIITVSEHSRQDLIRHFKMKPHRVSVIYEAADKRFHDPITPQEQQRVRLSYNLPAQFVFYIGSLEPRKNVPFLLKAFAAANLKGLNVVVGGGKPSEEEALLKTAADLGIADCVHPIGRVKDDDLPAIYSLAEAFVYPSEYEGFGLQICEAMAMGCPVLAAHSTCLPEILGTGGETFSLLNPSRLTDLLTQTHLDPAYREELQKRARARSHTFSWSQTAKDTLAVYQDLCSRRPAASTPTLPALSQP